jgi:hypothetical protein
MTFNADRESFEATMGRETEPFPGRKFAPGYLGQAAALDVYAEPGCVKQIPA